MISSLLTLEGWEYAPNRSSSPIPLVNSSYRSGILEPIQGVITEGYSND